jgi:hypothetical protein
MKDVSSHINRKDEIYVKAEDEHVVWRGACWGWVGGGGRAAYLLGLPRFVMT